MKDLDYYESLPYHAVLEHVATAEGDWYWQVHLQEIPAVVGIGATEDEAFDELRERFEEYVRFRLEEGLEIPEPGPGGVLDAAHDGGPYRRDGNGLRDGSGS